MSSLNAAQVAFLAFHAADPAPHAWDWQWVKAGAKDVEFTPDDMIVARRRANGGLTSCRISREHLAGLEPYWVRFLMGVNDAGLAAITLAGARAS
jgi:hypothetical protein